jgi:hypothetical protein
MDLVDLCKLFGILFFIIMCWYFIFVVFKTNTEFLKSVVSSSDVEGFEGKQLTELENFELDALDRVEKLEKTLQLDDDGKTEQRDLIISIIKNRKRLMSLELVAKTAGPLHPGTIPEMKSIKAIVDVFEHALEIIESGGGGEKEESSSGWS